MGVAMTASACLMGGLCLNVEIASHGCQKCRTATAYPIAAQVVILAVMGVFVICSKLVADGLL